MVNQSFQFYTVAFGYLHMSHSKHELIESLAHTPFTYVEKPRTLSVFDGDDIIAYVVFDENLEHIIAFDSCNSPIEKVKLQDTEISFTDYVKSLPTKQFIHCQNHQKTFELVNNRCKGCSMPGAYKGAEECYYSLAKCFEADDASNNLLISFDDLGMDMVTFEDKSYLPIPYELF